MSAASFLASVAAVVFLGAPLGIVHRVPVDVPADIDQRLGRVLVQLEANVAADGAVADIRLLSVSIVAAKVVMTADPAALREAAQTRAP